MRPELFIATLIACGGNPAVAPVISEPVPVIEAKAPVDRTTAAVAPIKAASGEPAQIVLVWEGVASLHKGFFSEPEFVHQLGRDLAGHVKPPINVYISFDSDRHVGRILVRLLPDTGMGLWKANGEGVDLTALSPVFQGLARYRSSVSSRFDTRVNAFRVGIDAYRGTQHCRFVPAGTPPPDGTVVDRCVQLNGVERCGQGEGTNLQFGKESQAAIERCLN